MSNVLVIYFSRSGATKNAALQLARELGADTEEITEDRSRAGILGWIRSGYEASFGKAPQIRSAIRDPAQYEMVVLATPTWNASPCSPMVAFVRRHRASLKNVAFLCTYGGRGRDQVFARLSEETGKEPAAVLAIPRAQLESGAAKLKIVSFAQRLKRSSDRPAATIRTTLPPSSFHPATVH